MPLGQIITLLTIGFAIAVGAIGVILGVAVYASPSLHAAFDQLTGVKRATPALLAGGVVAAAGVALAVGVVRAQQAIAGYLAERELAKLRAQFKEVEMALGTEKANEFLAYKVRCVLSDMGQSKVDAFGQHDLDKAAAEVGILPVQNRS